MKELFYPESVAIFGISEKSDNLAIEILANLIAFNYQGKIYCIGKEKGEVFGHSIITDISTITEPVDIATILTPARFVPEIVDKCEKLKVKYLHLASGGFEELSENGKKLQDEILAKTRKYGMRIIGPNCIGVINTENGFCTPFSKVKKISRGGISIMSQSGGVGISFLQTFDHEQLGIDKFISFGNKMDLDEVDFLEYLGADPCTKVICVYLEGFKRARVFFEIAKKIPKPVILLKNNKYAITANIAHSHTAAVVSNEEILRESARESNILLADNFRDAINISKVMTFSAMKGNHLAIISRSGGHAVIAADACAENGFELPDYPDEIIKEIKKCFRAGVVCPHNPLDLSDVFDLESYMGITEKIYNSDMFDGVILLLSSIRFPDEKADEIMLKKVMEIQKEKNKPLLFVPLYWKDQLERLRKHIFFPVFDNFEEAVKAMAVNRDYYKKGFKSSRVQVGKGKKDSESVSEMLKSDESYIFKYNELARYFSNAGVPVLEGIIIDSEDEIKNKRLKFPVVLKLLSDKFTHKSDIGAVKIGIKNLTELKKQVKLMKNIAHEKGEIKYKFLIHEQLIGGFEIIVGAKIDPEFGAVIMAGAGGKYVEVFNDIAIRLAPVSEETALEMIKSLRVFKLLSGVRGEKPYDINTLASIISNLSIIISEIKEIQEIDLNPLMVFEEGKGAIAVDMRIVKL